MKKVNWNSGFCYYPYGREEESKEIIIPHDAMIYEKRNPDTDNSYNTGYYPGGKYIYKKTFRADDEMKDKSIILEFEGIYRNSTVYLNGDEIGGHRYGFSQFEIDITDEIKFEEDNVLTVEVFNDECPNNRWYSGSGIYRPVNLFVGKKTHINPYGIKVKTTLMPDGTAKLYFDLDISEDGTEEYDTLIEVLYNNQVVASSYIGNVLSIESPRLWSADEPNLYTCRTVLKNKDRIIDEETVRFGIRDIKCNSTEGLLINGVKTFLNGGCVHHDNGILGAAAFRDAEYRKVKRIKKAGFNAIRCAHNPFSRSFLDACDEVGIYVMEEAFDMWLMHKTTYDYASDFRENYEDDLRRMVKKDYNHPSVIMYSIGNEIADTASRRAGELAQNMVDIIRGMGDDRLITHCVNSASVLTVQVTDNSIYEVDYKVENAEGANLLLESPLGNTIVDLADKLMPILTRLPASDNRTNHVYDKVDIAGMNYCLQGPLHFHKKYPLRVFLASETYAKDIMYNYPLGESTGIQIGDFVWTAWEYIGEASGGLYSYGDEEASLYKKYPALLAGDGHIDITGFYTPEVYFRQIVCGLRKRPYISVRPMDKEINRTHKSLWRVDDGVCSFSWDGYEGEKAVINVFSNSDSVGLYINRKLIAIKKVRNYKATFKTEYHPGTLVAVSYDNKGSKTGVSALRSGEGRPNLTIKPEKEIIKAFEESLIYVNIALKDKKGIVHIGRDTEIKVRVEGEGVLMGCGSANPVTEDEYVNDTTKTYYGRAQAVVRSTGKSGIIKIIASADEYEDASCIVTSSDSHVEEII